MNRSLELAASESHDLESDAASTVCLELTELQLTFVGGGIGTTVL
jgi:hypothetical protein